MTKSKITEYDQSADDNDDISGIGIRGSDPVRNMDNALREIMSHLANMNAGDAPLHDTFTLVDADDATKGVRFDAGQVTSGQTRILTAPDNDGVIITDTEFAAISGAGNGFDADKLDGQEGAFYLDAKNITAGPIDKDYLPAMISSDTTGNAANATNAINAIHSDSADKVKNTSGATKTVGFDFADVADNSEIALKVPSRSGTISITQFTVSTDAPTGGQDGDIWLQVDA